MRRNIGGVYLIVNGQTGEFYIGSTRCFASRFSEHRSKLRWGEHGNARLQRSWAKYGAEAFRLAALCVISDARERLAAEQALLDRAAAAPECYNILRTAAPLEERRQPRTRQPWSEGSRAKLRATIAEQMKDPAARAERASRLPRFGREKGWRMSDEQRAKVSAGCVGRIPWNKGVPRSAETRAKISATKRRKREEARVA